MTKRNNNNEIVPEEFPDYLNTTKPSYVQDYPAEDFKETDMFAPFFKRKRTWLVIIGLLLFGIALHFVPIDIQQHADAKLDPDKVKIGLAIFFCIAFLWLTEALPLAATSILIPVMAALTGIMDVKSALTSFAHPLIFVFFGGFALASAMAYQGVDRWIANRMVLLGKGNIITVSALLFGVTAFLSMWMSNTATTAMMIPLVLGVITQISCTKGKTTSSSTAIFLLLGVAYSASIGGIGTTIGSPPNGVAASAMGITFQEWMKFGIPSVIVLLPLMFLILFITSRPDTSQNIQVTKETFTFNWHRITTLIIFTTTALCWIFSKKLAALTGVTKYMDTIIALGAVISLLYFRVVRWRDIDNGTDWGVLLLFGGGLALSAVLKTTGTSMYLARIFSDEVAGLPLILIIGSVIILLLLFS